MRKYILTIAAALLAVLVSCGSASEGQETAAVNSGTPGTETSGQTTVSAVTAVALEIPETDMTGKTVTILTEGWCAYTPLSITDVSVSETNGEPINDAAYQREMEIEARYGCDLVVDNYENHADGADMLRKTVSSGEDVYAIALTRGVHYTGFLSNGYLTDLDTVPYLQLDAPYYDANSLDALAVNGRNFGIVSDITTLRYLTAYCAFINLQLMENYDLDNIYETVKAGKWTMETLYTYAKLHAQDIDDNGKYDNRDHYGFTYINESIDGLFGTFRMRMAELDEETGFRLTYNTEETIDKMITLGTYLEDETISYHVHKRSDDPNKDEVGMFIDGKAFVSLGGMYYGPQFRDMEDNFAILPMPKLEEDAAYATSFAVHFMPITVVPVTNDDLETTGILIEELSWRGYRDLYPAIYETVLKVKVARDEQSTEIIDLLFDNTYYDAGMLFNFGDLMGRLRENYKQHDHHFSSLFASLEKQVQNEMKQLLEAVNEYE